MTVFTWLIFRQIEWKKYTEVGIGTSKQNGGDSLSPTKESGNLNLKPILKRERPNSYM